MWQRIEGKSAVLTLGQQGNGIAAEDGKTYLTRSPDDLTIVFFRRRGRIKAPAAAEGNPAAEQNIPCHQVIGRIEPALVGGDALHFADPSEKIIHQVQLMGAEIVKEAATRNGRHHPPADLRI